MGRGSPLRQGGAVVLLVVLVAVAWRPVSHHVRAASLLLRIEGAEEGVSGFVARVGARPVRVETLSLPIGDVPMPARRYRPEGESGAGHLLLVHGVHFKGMDEPRLVDLARAMAASGLDVLTPHVGSLADFRIEPQVVRKIADAAAWFANESEGGAAGLPVGVLGISFAGGLALMAAAEAEARGGAIGWVMAVGAHHDLVRVGRWYAGEGEVGPDGEVAAAEPHPYGAGVFIRGALSRFFPEEDVPLAERALEHILREQASEARTLLDDMTEVGQAQLRRILSREPHPDLSRALVELVREEADALRAVSPVGRLGDFDTPVLLLHGAEDPVVPSIETRWLAREIPEPALRATLVTPLLRHAEALQEPSLRDEIQLVRVLAQMLALARP
jgi:pimeloyl-ACP methyl ester carboxylesterase